MQGEWQACRHARAEADLQISKGRGKLTSMQGLLHTDFNARSVEDWQHAREVADFQTCMGNGRFADMQGQGQTFRNARARGD